MHQLTDKREPTVEFLTPSPHQPQIIMHKQFLVLSHDMDTDNEQKLDKLKGIKEEAQFRLNHLSMRKKSNRTQEKYSKCDTLSPTHKLK